MIPEVVDQYAEEAAFLWLLRDLAVSAPHYLLADLARLDSRISAHLDGLRGEGKAGREVLQKGLEIGEPGEVFAAGVLAFGSGDSNGIQSILDVGTAKPETRRALISALGWLPFEAASSDITMLLSSDLSNLRQIGIAASAIHRKNPGAAALQAAFASDNPCLKARALRAAGELGLIDFQLALRANLKAKEPASRFWAAWSTALLGGHKDALSALRDVAEATGPFALRATILLIRRLPLRDARAWLFKLVKELKRDHVAIAAAGALGDADAVPWLIDQMKVPAMARVAGEAFSMITGAHIAYNKLETQKPEGFESGPTEDPNDDNVALDSDEHLPWPDPALVKAWWESRRGGYAKDTRYLRGKLITPEFLRETLRKGYQRQRAAAALELAILNPGKPLFEVRASGFVQQKVLGGS